MDKYGIPETLLGKCPDTIFVFDVKKQIVVDECVVASTAEMPPGFSQEAWENLMFDVKKQIDYLSTVKGGEYAAEGDRLDNFRRNARDAGCSMELVWRIYAGKHWDSISTWVRDIQAGKTRERAESIEGRFMDLIVYLILGIAIARERESGKHE